MAALYIQDNDYKYIYVCPHLVQRNVEGKTSLEIVNTHVVLTQKCAGSCAAPKSADRDGGETLVKMISQDVKYLNPQ